MNIKYFFINLALLVYSGCGLAYTNPSIATNINLFESEEIALEQAKQIQSIIHKINDLSHQLYLEELKGADDFIDDLPVYGFREDYADENLGEIEDAKEKGNSSSSIDKGAVVQRIGNYLIILRQGHLYSVRVGKKLKKIDDLKLKLEAVGQGTRFDKLFVYNNKLVIVGKNYAKKQSEYVFVDFNGKGKFERKNSYLVEEILKCSSISDSYVRCSPFVSSQHIVSNKLIITSMNVPFLPPESESDNSAFNPKVTKINEDGKIVSTSLLFEKNEIYSSIVDGKNLSMHSLAVCSIEQDDFRCKAKTILGGNLDQSFFTQDAAYFWVSGHRWSPDISKITEKDIKYLASIQYRRASIYRSVLYQIPIGNQPVSAIKIAGSPLGGRAFKSTDTHLYFVALYNDSRQNKKDYYSGRGESRFISIPRKLFGSEKIIELPIENYSRLSYDHYGNKAAIFHDNYVIFSSYIGRSQSSLKIASINDPTEIRSTVINADSIQLFSLRHGLVVFSYQIKDDASSFTTVKLGSNWGKHDELVFPKYTGKSEGRMIIKAENYLTNKDGSIFSVATTVREDESYYIGGVTIEKDDITNMSYIWISSDLNLNLMANVLGKEEIKWDLDSCDMSCIEWDYFSRAIFWEGRIFSLLKFEIIEGVRKGNKIKEIQRIDIRYDDK